MLLTDLLLSVAKRSAAGTRRPLGSRLISENEGRITKRPDSERYRRFELGDRSDMIEP
jgi:hypothetical protein